MFYKDIKLADDEIYLSLTGTFEAIPEKKWVPGYKFDICLLNNTIVGHCNLKLDNSELTKYCGNIGYKIFEEFRGCRYSAKASKLLLGLAKKHNLKYVTITCEAKNIASNKICQFLNAQFIETADIPKNHEMYFNCKKVNIYKINL